MRRGFIGNRQIKSSFISETALLNTLFDIASRYCYAKTKTLTFDKQDFHRRFGYFYASDADCIHIWYELPPYARIRLEIGLRFFARNDDFVGCGGAGAV